ncbi:histidine--tRNA ligase [Gynurincola endophyticus]|uniref:histidine--tRNA ligase n=1 Tax=Gynurincola endophyticus TaxID=2479004 RepID=UPI000F8E72A9|nr:histidine--tRNA ligase [Gynurincola endophyticus]
MSKPGLPQGTRDFAPAVVRKRHYIFNTIREIFERYGFQPLETPAMEQLDTLMGKYGEEGNKLIFKILNNGLENPAKHEEAQQAFEKALEGKNVKELTERALRYDLTIPFARFVAMNHGQLVFPFKRYQIQPVWRADRPARGRYREFYQCDADVVGSNSLLFETELVNIYNDALTKLGLNGFIIKINSRKILSALAELCGGADKMVDITVAIDKLDKIGIEKVKEELTQRGISTEQVGVIEKYLNINGSNTEMMTQVSALLSHIAIGQQGIDEIQYVLDHFSAGLNTGDKNPLQVDFTLARGLDYYTGLIFEVKAPETVKMGSIGGGGRYDNLTGLFGVNGISGVGISFGIDRIYDVMEELQLFPDTLNTTTQILFFNLGTAEGNQAYKLVQQLRKLGISAEIYHETAKFDKQFKYAEKKSIPYIAVLGSNELQNSSFNVKNLQTGEQKTFNYSEIDEKIFF